MTLCSEILRVVDSLQLTAVKKVATPVDWKANLRFSCNDKLFLSAARQRVHGCAVDAAGRGAETLSRRRVDHRGAFEEALPAHDAAVDIDITLSLVLMSL